ncbi:unnamed protein product [Closterium sp. NIES-54]
MGPPYFNPRMASASLAPVFFCLSHAPGVRRFLPVARRVAGVAYDGCGGESTGELGGSAGGRRGSAAPAPPRPLPPFSSIPLLRVQQWGRGSAAPAPPHPAPPFSSIPLLQVQHVLLLHTLLLLRCVLPSSTALPEPRCPAPTELHCPTAASTATATAAARAAIAGTTAVTALAFAAAMGGHQQPLPLPDTLSPQRLREWVIQRAHPGGGGFGFLRTVQRRQQSQQETFSPQLLSELVSQRCVPNSVEAATLGASESAAALGASESAAALGASESAVAFGARASTATGPASAEALHTFTLDSGASRCFFRDCTTLTPLAAPVPVSLADPTGGPVAARASTVLPCPAVPSDSWVDTFIPGGQRVAICKCSRTGRHLATFTRQPGSGLYTLTTESAQVAESGQVAASSRVSAPGQLAASCSCRVLSHQTLLWHHRLGHPSLSRLQSMHSHLLVSGLPRSLPSLPRSLAPPCLPCVKGRQRAAPHSSFPPTTAHLQTLHMDVSGTDQECYFLLVVDDHTCYTTVFPLRRKADVICVLIPWIRATCRQLRERFRRDLPVLRLHSYRGGEFSSGLLEEFCQDEGIRQTFTLPASPQQNGIAERRIGLIMELNLWPRVSEQETSPTLQWTGKVGDASVFRVWGALSLVHDAKASKLSSRTLRCIFLGFPTNAPPWQFYHPRSHRVFSSHDVTFDESVRFYRLNPHASHPAPLSPLFLVPVPPLVDPLPPQGPAPSSVSQVDPPPLAELLEISSDSSSPTEGGDPAADDTTATRRSRRLETPPGFPPRPSWPPPQPAGMK